MHIIRCSQCQRLNQVAPVALAQVSTLTCLRCGKLLPPDPRLVGRTSGSVSALDMMFAGLGLAFWPAGMAFTSLLATHPSVARQHNLKVGYAWAFMGMVLHLVLFLTCPPVHSFYVEFWQRLRSLT